MYPKKKGESHEYINILHRNKQDCEREYLDSLKRKYNDVHTYSIEKFKKGSKYLIGAKLKANGLEANCSLLTKVEGNSKFRKYSYEPTIAVGTHSIRKEHKLELTFIAYVLEQIQRKFPISGRIIDMSGKTHTVKLKTGSKILFSMLNPLKEWTNASSLESPPLILNKHCPLCQFNSFCRKKAEQEDNLSLLERVTPKVIQKYERKGIFTIKQLSYLYKPRRQRKRAKRNSVVHNLELQALAIRTDKVYLQKIPEITRKPIELFWV